MKVEVDEALLEKARRLGEHKTLVEAMRAALEWYAEAKATLRAAQKGLRRRTREYGRKKASLPKQSAAEARRQREEGYRALLRRKDNVEAMEWLRGSTPKSVRSIGEHSTEQSIAMVEHLQNLGAKRVIVAGRQTNKPYESADQLMVELPDDSKRRQRIFRWNNQRLREMGFDPEDDYGMKHLLVWFS